MSLNQCKIEVGVEKFAENPFLPQGPVSLCVVSYKHPDIIAELAVFGVECVPTERAEWLPEPVCDHADMQVFGFGEGRVLLDKKNSFLTKRLKAHGLKVEFCTKDTGNSYPDDVVLNCFIVKDILVCNKNTADEKIMMFADKCLYNAIHVNQGYTKCSSAILGDGSIITADESIHEKTTGIIDCLKISCGHIELPGYDYGFIGGCCGLIDKNKLFFTGDISAHPDYSKIERFCKKHNTQIVFIRDKPLRDIGGIITIKENFASAISLNKNLAK